MSQVVFLLLLAASLAFFARTTWLFGRAVFAGVAEPRRREILSYLALKERPVGDIVKSLKLEQPSVSKHLRVLKDVGLVHVRRDGRRALYRTNAEAIRPLHEWTSTFERYWANQLSRIKDRAEQTEKKNKEEA